ncbi:MAG TPA: DUF6178 family protein [Polyangia bacterium]|nr:DUF6178 family protein [Polyangia bacterium]
MTKDDESPDNVIALSRYRAQLGRGKRLRRADVLLASPDPERAIRALPGDELYYVVQEVGLRDAGDILIHARPEQVQAVLDFTLWQRDQLMPERMAEWIEVMAEAPPEKILEWIAGFDTELVGLLLTQSARIYDLSQEEPPDQGEGILYPTPDRLFVLDAIGFPQHEPTPATPGHAGEPPESARAMIRIVDGLYRADAQLARRLLIGARSEMTSSMEEMAFRWRSGRMSDLGFADYYEALEVYRELDPASVRIGEVKPGTRVRPKAAAGGRDDGDDALRAPAALIERLGAPSAFTRAVRRLTSPDEVADLHFTLVALTNRVLAADRITPGDDEAVAAALARLAATLDIAVEFLARGDEDRALEAVRTVALVRLHRLGVSLVGKVRQLAMALKAHGPFAAAGRDLFEPDDAAIIEAVTRLRPLFPGVLETPPKPTDRPFDSMADIARAKSAIERAAAAQALLVGLGVRADQLSEQALEGTTGADAAALDAGVLARTALVLALLEGGGANFRSGFKQPMSFRPLSPDEVREFEKRVSASKTGSAKDEKSAVKPGDVKRKAKAILDAAAPKNLGDAVAEVIRRWIDSLSPLEPVLVKAPPRRRRR